MDILNATLIADLTAAVYSVIGKNKLDYTKENSVKVVLALANICSSLCAIAKLDFDTFLQEAKVSHDDFMKSDLIVDLQKQYPVKDSAATSSEVNDYAGKQSKLCYVIETKSPEFSSFSTSVFKLVFDKCMEIMEEKKLLISDMPVLIGCLASIAAYFTSFYSVNREVLTDAIINYYQAMDSYDPNKNVDENVEKLKLKINSTNNVSPVANTSNKKKFDLN